tara:strand:+ start:909 stop:2450 length:1542 start_codon:yes stop_codon:yes gene_type:complete
MLKKIIVILTILTSSLVAEEQTTNNLITNGNFETGNANGWTATGDVQVLNDCCELNGVASNYDLEFGDNGAIEQDFNLTSDTITQPMLNNGITLNSSIEAQNGECGVAGCWGGQGGADTFSNTLTIKDNAGNVLATVTTNRTDITNINGQNFTDRLIYTGVGSNIGNINISGSDANAPSNLGGPNIDNVSVTMTYDNAVLASSVQTSLVEVSENLSTEFIEFREIFKKLELNEEIQFEPVTMEEAEEFEQPTMIIALPEPKEELGKGGNMFVFQPPSLLLSEKEEPTNMMSPPMMAYLSPSEEEPTEITASPVETFTKMFTPAPEPKEQGPGPGVSTLPLMSEEQEEESGINAMPMLEPEEKEKEVKKINEEKNKEKKSVRKATAKPSVQNAKTKKQKSIQQKKIIKANLVKIMDQIDAQVKDIGKNLQVKNVIKLQAMMDNSKLDLYQKEFYKPQDIYMQQLNIQDNRQLYANVSLDTYIQNDKIGNKTKVLNQIRQEKQRLLIELEMLKND